MSGIVPSKLKSARILPIFKGSGSPELPGNYRPISILPVCSKILEKIIYEQMIQTIGDNCLFVRQYGFRRGLGTTDAIRDLIDDLHEAIHLGKFSIGIFIDFRKAFDTVHHDILLRKLKGYGFRGVAQSWLEDYLKCRSQMVKLNNTVSSRLPVKVGVPQGSILGPLLFLLYVNDMKDYIKHGKLRLFADDTNIFYDTKDIGIATMQINEDMYGLNKWLKMNKLTVNTTKSNYIVVKCPRKRVADISVKLQNDTLRRMDHVKYLGVYIDQHLTFRPHIEYLCKKISPTIGVLGKLRWLFPKNICVLLYNSLIHSQLAYCIGSWGSASKAAISPLEILHKKVVRYISHSTYTAHAAPLFKELGILTVREMFFTKVCMLVYQELRGLNNGRDYKFQKVNHVYKTRSVTNDCLQLPEGPVGVVTNSLFRTLSYVGPRFFNYLPTDVKGLNSCSLFKRNLKNWVQEAQIPVYNLMYTHR